LYHDSNRLPAEGQGPSPRRTSLSSSLSRAIA
jgi:hypothetical protein